MKKILAVALSILMLLPFTFLFASAEATVLTESELIFDEEGKFRIAVFADCQDDVFPDARMLKMIEYCIETEKPDFVVLDGDNICQPVYALHNQAATTLLESLAKAGVPFGFVFGNHDAETLSKDLIMQSFHNCGATCLTYNSDDSITGLGNSNLPVMSSDGSGEIAFNLFLIDSNMYDEVNGGYDYVHEDQIEWYRNTSLALEEAAGEKVYSLVFQHIIVPEIFDLMVEVEESEKQYTYNGKHYKYEFIDGVTKSCENFGEHPCPPNTNHGQVDAMLERGDVLGIVTGHDHTNSFVVNYNGIDFIQTPGITFQSYGAKEARGYRIIDIDEADTSTYTTYVVKYADVFDDGEKAITLEIIQVTIREFFKLFTTLFKTIGNIIGIARS